MYKMTPPVMKTDYGNIFEKICSAIDFLLQCRCESLAIYSSSYEK